jgi:hypothetical protein
MDFPSNQQRVTAMALASKELQEIGETLSSPQADAGVFARLRSRFPHLSWTRCDASDVTESPFRSYPGFDLHLVDRTDHCVQITSDPARATGIVLAARGATS